MHITNNLGGTIKGNNGSGVNIDGFNAKEVVTAVNSSTLTGNGVTADGDGVDVDGIVNITNSGLIKDGSDSGIAFTSPLASGFSHTINNLAGGMIHGSWCYRICNTHSSRRRNN